MKYVVFAATFMMAMVGWSLPNLSWSSGLSDRSWSSLEKDPGITLEWPKYQGFKVRDLCFENSTNSFQSVRAVSYCNQTVVKMEACEYTSTEDSSLMCREINKGDKIYGQEFIQETYGCDGFSTYDTVSISRVHTEEVCSQWKTHESPDEGGPALECIAWKNVTRTAPLTHQVQVYSYYPNSESSPNWIGTKTYKIPACH